ncbi:sigma-70 family RNA polymerase sigma factor [Peptostreptococcus equinus]|uniref:Sigma-70 family RNA polymerase sigma factor n=1 Tax=Peptostreptococcus equinus TaxID=3003601 RepID=A0ABY7JLZ7_9FIRM|nr:sigma-70 family RNA polymerase sigma factor [Peptostreptococcus sp. CBA3647]WAW14105.1 sigma-70 family RNA polymerase sigma factor [Peptostreptococcus sp. CBA3647]
MTRKFKTAEKNRVNYVYYTADGKKIVINPGENDVTEEMITLLHTYDDEEVDADRREDYHVPVRFEGYSDDEGSELESRNSYLADTSADPLEKLMDAIKEEELEIKISNLKSALYTLTEKQQETIYKKFFKNMTNTAIAIEDGVSEAAIRNRLEKIYKNLQKKI